MTEQATQDPPANPPASPETTGDPPETNDASKFAGRFDTPEALEQGYANIRQKLNLPATEEGKPLYGKDGVFADITAAESAYKDLRAIMDRGNPGPKPTESTQTDGLEVKPEAPSDPFEAVQQELASKGIDDALQKSISETWAKDGKLTDDQYKMLQEKGGYSEAVVNAHMSALASLAQTTVTAQQGKIDAAIDSAAQSVGGDEQLQNLLKWAGTKYQGAELDDLNRRLKDPGLLQGAVSQIAASHRAAVGAGDAQPLISETHTADGSVSVQTPAELQGLFKKAQQGDKQATAALLKLDANKFAALATASTK